MVESEEIVLDDIVALSAGDQATADLIVLTGEEFSQSFFFHVHDASF